MSQDLVKSGRYKAKVVDHGITKTKAGDPQATVRFELETSVGYRELTWFGSFNGGAVEHTVRALVNCGLKGSNPAGDLEIGKEVSIVVEIDKDQNGNDRNVIRWVNAPGGVLNKMDKREAGALLERFSGVVMALKEKDGHPAVKAAPQEDRLPWED
jgi:hypothetical protein